MSIPEEYIILTKRDLQNKECILRVKYQGQWHTHVTAYEVPSFISGQQVGAIVMLHGDLLEVILERKIGE